MSELNKKGKLIVIESLGDNYGKTTIANELKSRLENSSIYSFPSHLNPMGLFINEMLITGDINLLEMDQEFLSSIYLYDFKMVYDIYIKNDLDRGKDVILDRYYFSTLVYQTAINELQGKYDGEEFYKNMVNFIDKYLKLPRPDNIVVLVDTHGASRDMDNKNDQFERNEDLQNLVKIIGKKVTLDNNFNNLTYLDISDTHGKRKPLEYNVCKVLELIKLDQ